MKFQNDIWNDDGEIVILLEAASIIRIPVMLAHQSADNFVQNAVILFKIQDLICYKFWMFRVNFHAKIFNTVEAIGEEYTFIFGFITNNGKNH